jgi:hypothetical protein
MPVIVIGSSTITENSLSQLIIGSETLTPGGVITYDGQSISLSPSDGAVIVNPAQPTTFTTAPFSVSDISSVVVAGQTLTYGGLVTVGGDILSLAPSGTQIMIIGTVTVGGVSTATATAAGHSKNAGEKFSANFAFIALQLSVSVLAFWLW